MEVDENENTAYQSREIARNKMLREIYSTKGMHCEKGKISSQ